ncbi:MAG: insulinase family protein [Bdellovibrio sp.]|nr:insulinase family protein [Bdellovibrio sp.]
MRHLLKVFLLFSFLCSAAYSSPVEPVSEVLPNGLEVVWFYQPDLPVVDLSLVVRAGFRDDKSGKSGTAALLLTLLDRGSAGKSALETARFVEEMGVSRLLNSQDDQTLIQFHGLALDSALMVKALAEMVLKPNLAADEFVREKRKILERWNHLENAAETVSTMVQHRLLASGTSYARGAMSSLSDLKNIKREDLIDFHKTYFTPQNAFLAVVGSFDRAAMRNTIVNEFSSPNSQWPGSGIPKRIRKNHFETRLLRGTSKTNDPVFVINRSGGTQTSLKLSYKIPPLEVKNYFPLLVLNAAIGEYIDSRLTTIIRDKLGLTYGIESSLSFTQEMGEFSVVSSARNENIAFLVQRTEGVIEDLFKEPMTQEEIDNAKSFLIGSFGVSHASLPAYASRWLLMRELGLPSDFVTKYAERIQEVQLTEVHRVLKEALQLKKKVIILTGDLPAIQKSFECRKSFSLQGAYLR